MRLLPSTRFIMYVTRHYHWLVEPVAHFYKKYLDVSLLFFSDRPVPGHKFWEIFPKDFPLYEQSCGGIVKEALERIRQPLVTIGFMDLLPCASVDMRSLGLLQNYMTYDPRVARGNLWSEVQWAIQWAGRLVYQREGFMIRKLSPQDPNIGQIGSTSLMPALWNREFLLGFIEDDWTLDVIELPGQHKFMKQAFWYSIGTFPGLVDYCHLCYTSDKKIVRTSTISDPEDRAFVDDLVPGEFNIE